MELTPVKIPGFQPLWSAVLYSAHAHDLGRRCLLQGRMHKVSGHFSKSWEERYFCLMPGSLLFSLVDFDSPEDPQPKGIVIMNRDSVVEAAEVMGKKHALIIKPNPTDPAARHMQLACESEDEAREWTEALFKASMGAWLQEQSEKDARDAAERQGAAATRLAQLQHLLRDAEDALKAESEKHAAAVARIASLESQVTVLSDATCDVVRRLEDGPISSLAAITDDLLVALKALAKPGDVATFSESFRALSPRRKGLQVRDSQPVPAASAECNADAAARTEADSAAADIAASADRLRSVCEVLRLQTCSIAPAVAHLSSTSATAAHDLATTQSALADSQSKIEAAACAFAAKDARVRAGLALLKSRVAEEAEAARSAVAEAAALRGELVTASASQLHAEGKYQALAQEHRKCYERIAAAEARAKAAAAAAAPQRPEQPEPQRNSKETHPHDETPLASQQGDVQPPASSGAAAAVATSGLDGSAHPPGAAPHAASSSSAAPHPVSADASAIALDLDSSLLSIDGGDAAHPPPRLAAAAAAAAAAGAAPLSGASLVSPLDGSPPRNRSSSMPPGPPSGGAPGAVATGPAGGTSASPGRRGSGALPPAAVTSAMPGTAGAPMPPSRVAGAPPVVGGSRVAASAHPAPTDAPAAPRLPLSPARPSFASAAPPRAAAAAVAGGGVGLGLDILADPFPGRLYVLVAVARGLPHDAFGGFGTPTLRARVRAFRQERLGRPLDCYERGPGAASGGVLRGAGAPTLGCVLHSQVHAFRVTGPLNSARLRLDLLAHRLMRGDVPVGGATADLSCLEDWPGQPHAVWLALHPPQPPPSAAAAAAEAAAEPSPAEVLAPVEASLVQPLLALQPAVGGGGGRGGGGRRRGAAGLAASPAPRGWADAAPSGGRGLRRRRRRLGAALRREGPPAAAHRRGGGRRLRPRAGRLLPHARGQARVLLPASRRPAAATAAAQRCPPCPDPCGHRRRANRCCCACRRRRRRRAGSRCLGRSCGRSSCCWGPSRCGSAGGGGGGPVDPGVWE